MSQGRSSSFIGLPRELFAAEFKKSALEAANSGKSFAGRRELSSSERVASRSSCHLTRRGKVALRDAVTRPSKRLSSWELLNLGQKDRALKTELDRQRAKEQTGQQEKAYERQSGTGAGTITEGAILKRLRSVERAVRSDLSVLDRWRLVGFPFF
jgi:hypothetical protein